MMMLMMMVMMMMMTIIIIIIIIIIKVRYVCLLSQAFSSQYFSWNSGDPHRSDFQASHCSTFRIMCAVPSVAVFCSESIECFPGTGSKFFLKLLVTIPLAPIITGTIVHFRFHIRCLSIHKLLNFNFFSASFCTTFLSADIGTCACFLFFDFNYYIWSTCCNFSRNYFSLMFISIPHMFRTTMCPSSGELIVSVRHLVCFQSDIHQILVFRETYTRYLF